MWYAFEAKMQNTNVSNQCTIKMHLTQLCSVSGIYNSSNCCGSLYLSIIYLNRGISCLVVDCVNIYDGGDIRSHNKSKLHAVGVCLLHIHFYLFWEPSYITLKLCVHLHSWTQNAQVWNTVCGSISNKKNITYQHFAKEISLEINLAVCEGSPP